MSRIVTSRTLSIVEDGETDASNMLSGQWTVVTDSCTDWSAKGKMLQIDTFSDWGEIFNVQQFQYINGCKQMNNLKRKPYHNGVRSKTERHQCTSAISLCKKGHLKGRQGIRPMDHKFTICFIRRTGNHIWLRTLSTIQSRGVLHRIQIQIHKC